MSGRVRGPSRARTGEGGSAAWWRAADLAVLAGMIVLGSALLVPTYGSRAPVVTTATGAVLAALVLVLVHRLRLPPAAAVLGITVGTVVFGALVVAPGQRVAGLVPSWPAMTAVLRGSVSGWRDLLTVATPTGVVGSLLVPPLLIGAVGTGLCGALVATRRPPLALLVPAATMVLFALLGNRLVPPATVAVVAALSLVAGVGWSVWVNSRDRRRALARGGSDSTHSDHLAAAARAAGPIGSQALAARRMVITAAILAIAATVGVLTATAGTPERTVLRDVVEVPADPAAFPSPLSTFRSYTKDRADEVELTVAGLPAGTRLRLASLDVYDGRQFLASDGEGPFLRIGRQRPAPDGARLGTVTVTMRGYPGSFLPLPGPIVQLDFGGPRAIQLTEDLRYSERAATGLLPGGWRPGDSYVVTSALPAQPSQAALAVAQPQAMSFPSTVPLPDLVRAAANRYAGGASGTAAQVEAIRAGLAADGLFSHGDAGARRSAAGHGLDRIAAMITQSPMVGDQEQYAALMALLVRSLGVPARVAVGFAPSSTGSSPAGSSATGSSATGSTATGSTATGSTATGSTATGSSATGSSAAGAVPVLGRDITAWVEVPFQGYGWVAFDPSPPPDKQSPKAEQQSSTQRRAVTGDVPPALPQAQPDSVDTENANQRPDAGKPEAPAPAADDSVWQLVLIAVAGIAGMLVLLALPVVFILWRKSARRRRRRRAEQPRDQITGGWEQLLDTAVDTGYRPQPWHTRSEAAADLQTSGVLLVDWLAPAADAAEFSPGPVNPERARGYWREVDDRSAELLGGLPLWRRWRARLSLASLRRRPA